MLVAAKPTHFRIGAGAGFVITLNRRSANASRHRAKEGITSGSESVRSKTGQQAEYRRCKTKSVAQK
jgi:hypothetical protein